MKCPNCKLLNPPGAERCDCGYDFELHDVRTSYLTDSPHSAPSGRSGLMTFQGCLLGAAILMAVLALLAFGLCGKR